VKKQWQWENLKKQRQWKNLFGFGAFEEIKWQRQVQQRFRRLESDRPRFRLVASIECLSIWLARWLIFLEAAGAGYCGLSDDNFPIRLKRTISFEFSHRLDGAACAIPPAPSFIVHCDFFSLDASKLASQRKHSIEGVDRLHGNS
jgi:hypothetical protein